MKLRNSARNINRIIIHSTATPEGREVSVDDITRWHKNRGFSTIGYHYVIGLDGEIEVGRSVQDSGAHAKGYNRRSIGVVYVGGMNKTMSKAKDTRTELQDVALTNLIKSLLKLYPTATVHGHNEFSDKACPSFNVQEEYGFIWEPKETKDLLIKEEEENDEE
jgi:N-acetylmuramoyl-L-alanine amidase